MYKIQIETGIQPIEGIDMVLFFWLALSCMILYRLWAIFWNTVIVQSQKPLIDAILIIFDVYLLREVYYGHAHVSLILC